MGFSSLALRVLLLSLVSSHANPCSEQDKRSLLQFIAGLSMDSGLAMPWRNDTADCCLWEGITCNGEGVVIEVSLAGRGLQGRISPALADLTGLLHINLSHNSLSGGDLPLEQLMSSSSIAIIDVSFNRLEGELNELPSSVTHGLPLQVLNISSNQFTGEFPSRIWKSTKNMITLNVSNNSFSGQVPSSFCLASASFTILELQYNQFSGNIPPVLGNCSKLKVFKVAHNKLSGTIPDELFNATSLEHLSFRNTGLRGTLGGAHVAKLGDLVTLDLGENNFTCRIPASIGLLDRLKELHLDHNSMSGELPSTMCNCTNLMIIDLKENYSGELTKVNFSTLINLKTLDLLYNNFTGTIPESIFSCSNMNALRLAGNNLHGQLSPRIGNLKSLMFLSLDSNNFTNIIHALHVLKDCKNLTLLLLGNTFIGEAMPEDERIDGFQNLQVFSVSRSSLTGKMPLWLSKLKNLCMLFLYNNQLSGTIPVFKGPSLQYMINSAFLKVLKLGYNNFTHRGPVDTDCCEWEGITSSCDGVIILLFSCISMIAEAHSMYKLNSNCQD